MIYYRKTLFGRGPKLTAVQQDVGFLLVGTLSTQHIVTVSLEPLFHLGLSCESIAVGAGRQWLDNLACDGVLGFVVGWIFMAGGAAPLLPVLGVKELLTPQLLPCRTDPRSSLAALGGWPHSPKA